MCVVKETYDDGVSHVIQILDNSHAAIRHSLRTESLLKLETVVKLVFGWEKFVFDDITILVDITSHKHFKWTIDLDEAQITPRFIAEILF